MRNRERARGARKRSGRAHRVNLHETAALSSTPERSILISEVAPRQAKVVELRYFGGLSEDLAKAWLLRELSPKTGRAFA